MRTTNTAIFSIRDVVKSHSGKSKSSSSNSKFKSSDSEIVKSKSKSTGRTFKSSSSSSPQVSLSFDLPPKIGKTYLPHITWPPPQRNVYLNEKSGTHFTNVCDHIRCQVYTTNKHLAAWLFNVNNNFISACGWLHVHLISIAFEKHASW